MIATYVYLMHSPSLDICKIGVSVRPDGARSRLYRVRAVMDLPDLQVIHTIRCTYRDTDTEYLLHHTFRENRLEGEWFCLSSEEIEQIKQLKTDKDVMLTLFLAWHTWLKARTLKQFSLRNYLICKYYAEITGTHTSDWLPNLPGHWPAPDTWDNLGNWGIPSPSKPPQKVHVPRIRLRDFAQEIQRLYDSGMTQGALAKRYGVTQVSISRVVCRAARGIKPKNARLSDNDVREIRRLHSSEVGQTEIAKRYGVTQGAIWAIIHGHTWKHVGDIQQDKQP